jgi:hypothetical protein
MGLYASSTQPVQIPGVDPFVLTGIVELEPTLGLVGALGTEVAIDVLVAVGDGVVDKTVGVRVETTTVSVFPEVDPTFKLYVDEELSALVSVCPGGFNFIVWKRTVCGALASGHVSKRPFVIVRTSPIIQTRMCAGSRQCRAQQGLGPHRLAFVCTLTSDCKTKERTVARLPTRLCSESRRRGKRRGPDSARIFGGLSSVPHHSAPAAADGIGGSAAFSA